MADGRYLTDDSYRQWTRDEISVDDVLVGEAIKAAEQQIDNMTGRRFEVASASSDRSFVPYPCSRDLRIYDCTSVTSVTENGVTLTEGTHYQLEPINGLSSSGESVPYNSIRRLRSSWYTYDGEATVTVNAAWGWTAIPPQVLEACKILTQDILSNRDYRNGIVVATEAAVSAARENRTVAMMVAHYNRNVLVA